LGQVDVISEILPLSVMLPAPGQGALAVQCRDDAQWRAFLAPIHDSQTQHATDAERGFLSALGGGCALPIAAYAQSTDDQFALTGRIITRDGAQLWEDSVSTPMDNLGSIGAQLAEKLRSKGAKWD
jgi:hydroxymethylbilane synthase